MRCCFLEYSHLLFHLLARASVALYTYTLTWSGPSVIHSLLACVQFRVYLLVPIAPHSFNPPARIPARDVVAFLALLHDGFRNAGYISPSAAPGQRYLPPPLDPAGLRPASLQDGAYIRRKAISAVDRLRDITPLFDIDGGFVHEPAAWQPQLDPAPLPRIGSASQPRHWTKRQ